MDETPKRFFRYSRMLLSSSVARKLRGGSCLAMNRIVRLQYYYVKGKVRAMKPYERFNSSVPPSARVAARLSGEVMDIREVAEYLKVSVSTVKREVKSGGIPAVKIGCQYRFRRADILALWDRNK
jgi:excisionase family DNA binding protein